MIVRNNRCYADDSAEELCVTSAEDLGDYKLRVAFSGKDARLFDGTCLFSGEVFQPLRDQKVFSDFKLDYETLTWLGGKADIAPEFVLENSIPV